MTFQERRSLVSIVSNLLIIAVYSAMMLQRYPDSGDYSPEVFKFWGAFILILIPVSVVARIVVHLVFVGLNALATHEGEPDFLDERDRLIELKSARNALYTFMFGFIIAMTSVALDQPPAVMFVLLITFGLLADVLSDVSQFIYYRRDA